MNKNNTMISTVAVISITPFFSLVATSLNAGNAVFASWNAPTHIKAFESTKDHKNYHATANLEDGVICATSRTTCPPPGGGGATS